MTAVVAGAAWGEPCAAVVADAFDVADSRASQMRAL